MNLIITCILINSLSAKPVSFVRKFAENDEIDKFENYLPKSSDMELQKYRYSTFGADNDDLFKEDVQIHGLKDNNNTNKEVEKAKTLGDVVEFVVDGVSAGINLFSEVKDILSTLSPETTTIIEETTTSESIKENYELDPLLDNASLKASRPVRQEEGSNEVEETVTSGPTTREKESQESSEEEEEPNMVTGLISAFLGGLSRPDGSVDVEAITALLGSLSVQQPDGSYTFDGLTELLMSFFGGDEGGSDFGAFLGGILGAFVKGVANPPGATGAGRFLGNLLGGVLPALSGPAPTKEGQAPQPGLDSGGFLSGLLSSLFGSSGAGSSAGGSNPSDSSNSSGSPANGGGGAGSKFSLFKAIFSMITSVFSSSSGAH